MRFYNVFSFKKFAYTTFWYFCGVLSNALQLHIEHELDIFFALQ